MSTFDNRTGGRLRFRPVTTMTPELAAQLSANPDCAERSESDEVRRRWNTTIHESCHVVVAAVLRLNPQMAVLMPGGGGMITYGWPGLGGFRRAVVAVAGCIAWEMKFPTPTALPTRPPVTLTNTQVCMLEAAYEESPMSDAEVVAAWADRLPARFVQRIDRATQTARGILQRHEANVLHIALSLWMRGILLPNDLQPLLPKRPRKATETPQDETSRAGSSCWNIRTALSNWGRF